MSIDKLSVALLSALSGATSPQKSTAPASPRQPRSLLHPCVVRMAEGDSKRSLFCFHPAGGELSIYRPLADELAGRCTVYGIQSPSRAGLENEPSSLRDLCQAYANLVREVQAEGPYRLFGFSLGGLIAIGTARALERAGQMVTLVGVAECDLRWCTPQADRSSVLSHLGTQLYEQLRSELQILREQPRDRLESEVQSLVKSLVAAPPGQSGSTILNWVTSSEYLTGEIPRDLVAAHFARIEAHLRLVLTAGDTERLEAPLYIWTARHGLIRDARHWECVTDKPAGAWEFDGGHFEVLMGANAKSIAYPLEQIMSNR